MKRSLNFNFLISDRGSGLALIFVLCCSLLSNGQASEVSPFNNPFDPTTDFLGWNPGVNSAVEIRHNTLGQPIIFSTDGTERMRILPSRTVAVNTTSNESARFNIEQDVTKGTAVRAQLSNNNGYTYNRGFWARMYAGNQIVYGIVTFTAGVFSEVDFALRGIAYGPNFNYGIYAHTQGNGQQGNPNQGNWAGVFQGNVYITNGTYLGSDASLKHNVEPLQGARENLLMMRPVSFYFTEHDMLNLSDQRQYGFIAQEMQEVYPDLVREVSLPIPDIEAGSSEIFNHLALNRIELIPILVQGMKEHQEFFDENNNQINQLSAEINDIQSFINSLNIEE